MQHPWDYISVLLGGAGLGAILKWLDSRGKTRHYTMGMVDQAVQTAFSGLNDEIMRLNAQITEMRKLHQNCESALERAWLEQDKLRCRIEELERGKNAE